MKEKNSFSEIRNMVILIIILLTILCIIEPNYFVKLVMGSFFSIGFVKLIIDASDKKRK